MKSLFSLLLLSLPLAAQVQMSYSYSSYVNQSADFSDIYETAVVDGNASCTPTTNEINLCPAVLHTPSVYVQIGTVSGWNVGNGVLPQIYINESNAQTLTNAVAGTDYAENNVEKVMCNFAGVVFLFQESPGALIGFRRSAYQYAGWNPANPMHCTWTMTCHGACTDPSYNTYPDPSTNQCVDMGPPPILYKEFVDLVLQLGGGLPYECVLRHKFCVHIPTPGVCDPIH